LRLLAIADDEHELVGWRTKARHLADGVWITDDGPDERTGPVGKWHAVRTGSPRSLCGRALGDHMVSTAETFLSELCRKCLQGFL
jgi:hypothetical protein